MASLGPVQELTAPPHWRAVDLLSDLHLSEATPRTAQAFIDHLSATDADAVLVLGDLFEVWFGDEQQDQPLEGRCLRALADASRRLFVGLMVGNRDFLLSSAVVAQAGAKLLHDPLPLRGFGPTTLLSHGDALCLADAEYQAFRREVRSPSWQAGFLSQPAAERIRLARHIRSQSQQRRTLGQLSADQADVDPQAARQELLRAGCSVLVHGHTHRPADHDLGQGLRRVVLSDWDLEDKVPRAEVLRLTPTGMHRLAPLRPRHLSSV